MEALQADYVAVVELRHQEKEFRLRPRVCCDYLVHALQRRHSGRWTPQLVASRLRSTAVPGNCTPADVEMVSFLGPVVKLEDQRAVRVCEVRRDEEAGRTELEVVGVSVETQNGCLLYTSPSPRDATLSRMPSSA